nr:serine carboxypeptidase-like 33 [Ipomoea batatas]
MAPHNRTSLLLGFLLVWVLCAESSSSSPKAQESDKIGYLPGQPSAPLLTHFSGYITVNQSHGRALFYWFFEAQSQPSTKPLVLWLNGGPGCSSIGYGAAAELGPLRVKRNGVGLHFNKYSWNKEANLLFVESPVGVGFSYTNTSSDLTTLDDKFVAQDTYIFLVNWLERFPQFKGHDFFIAGESYAGHYVPQLAEVVFDRNRDRGIYPRINLKGFIVCGNPETNDYYDYKGLLEYAWSHAVISDQQYEKAKEVCNFTQENWSDKCNEAMSIVFSKYEEIDIYNIYGPRCLLNGSSSATGIRGGVLDLAITNKERTYAYRRMKRIPGGYDPCYSPYSEQYFNRIDVQKAFHANIRAPGSTVNWKTCRLVPFDFASIS